jgi:iron complex transport system substrate-binding protein
MTQKKSERKKSLAINSYGVVVLVLVLVAGAAAGAGCTSPENSPVTIPATTMVTTVPGPATEAARTPALSIPLRRIIVTNANAAELLMAIGAEDSIVGISDTVKTHPVLGPRFSQVTSIGNWQTPDVETILSLHPDAVISYASYQPKNIDKITSANITILPIDCYKIDTLVSDARKLGNLTGKESGAEEYVEFVESGETLVRSRLGTPAGVDMPRVYFESYSDYSTLTGGTGADSLVTMAGGENIAGLLPVSSPKVNAEWLVAQNPDIIVKVVASTKKDLDFKEVRSALENREGIRNTSAVKNNQVYVISNDIVYGPRAVIGLLYFAEILHPDKFSDLDSAKMLDEYAGRFAPGTNTTEVMYPAHAA